MRCEDCLPLVEPFFEGVLARPEAAGVSAHLASCAACSNALEALREEDEMYADFWREAAVQTPTWSAVLSGIEADRRAHAAHEPPARTSKWTTLLAVFKLKPLVPAALALGAVLVCLLVFGQWAGRRGAAPAGDLAARNESKRAATASTSTSVSTGASASPANEQASAVDKTGTSAGVGSGPGARAKPEAQAGVVSLRLHPARESATNARRAPVTEAAVSPVVAAASVAAAPAAVDAARVERALLLSRAAAASTLKGPAGAGQMGEDVSQHFEGMELLFRSLKNTGGAGPTVDIGYEKGLSRRLLNRNVLLRREAESRGNLPLEELLDTVEPVFAEIANLPEQASPAEVAQIKERIQKKGVLALLRAYAAAPAPEAAREGF